MKGRCSCCLAVLAVCDEAQRHGMKSIDLQAIRKIITEHRTPSNNEMLVVDLQQ